MSSKYDYYTPFANKKRLKDVDGIYRNTGTGKILKLRNMYFQGLVCGETDKPFDAYLGEITVEGEQPTKNCVIDFHVFSEFKKIF